MKNLTLSMALLLCIVTTHAQNKPQGLTSHPNQTDSALTAENASTLVKAPVGQVTHLVALMYIIAHESEEFGQIPIYLRLNHLLPPATDDTTKGGAAGKVSTNP